MIAIDGSIEPAPIIPLSNSRKSTMFGWFCGCMYSGTKGELKVFARYVDDIIRPIKTREIDQLLAKFNQLHPNLRFTIERCVEQKIPFLEMKLSTRDGRMSTIWYTQPTDTGTSMSFRAIAPMRYKRNLISGHIHRSFNSCSDWKSFHAGIEKAKKIWSINFYLRAFCESILKDTLQRLLTHEKAEKLDKKLSFIIILHAVSRKNL